MTTRGRIVVAMSGGVDSSATAALLKEQGWDVVGVTLRLYDSGEAAGKPGSCCAGKDIRDARRVADTLGIAHYVIDEEAVFKRDVIAPFAEAYIKGETPIPCVACNSTVKFRDLLNLARELGGDALATGHYARREDGPDGPRLLRGADLVRDQSYFLFATTKEQLGFVQFPLGGMVNKDETRAIAARYGLAVASKPDSQDICFVPGGDYARIVEKLRPDAADPGEIVDQAGTVLGRHQGIIHYTIGQRRGLNLGGGDPLYVLRLDAAAKRVVVGPKAALGSLRVSVRDVNWLGGEHAEGDSFRAAVKVRSTRPPAAATITFTAGNGALVELDAAEEAVAPGQACVFYDGDRVLGGGFITRARHEQAAA